MDERVCPFEYKRFVIQVKFLVLLFFNLFQISLPLCLRFYTQQEQQMASIAAESSAKGPKLGTVLPSSEVEGLEVKSDRRDRLREIELKMQQRWKENKTFEMDAPKEYTQADKKKFFSRFRTVLMNGKIQLGHTFSLTKAEFAAGYHMVKGETVLSLRFPLHGNAIQAAANKLKKEIEKFGVENCKKATLKLKSA